MVAGRNTFETHRAKTWVRRDQTELTLSSERTYLVTRCPLALNRRLSIATARPLRSTAEEPCAWSWTQGVLDRVKGCGGRRGSSMLVNSICTGLEGSDGLHFDSGRELSFHVILELACLSSHKSSCTPLASFGYLIYLFKIGCLIVLPSFS